MKVSCLQENLAKGLSIVGRAVGSRTTLPVLSNILLATDNGRLKMTATNLETTITCWVNAKVAEEGATTTPARTFSDLVNALPPEQVELELAPETQTLHVASGRTEANIRGIDANEFPLIPDPDITQGIRLDAGEFKQMVSKVAFAAAADDARPALAGVSVRFNGAQLEMVATDAFRLSVVSAEIPSAVSESIAVIVPAKAMNEVARVITDNDETVYVVFLDGRNQVAFRMDSVVIVAQLIEGTFPDVSPIIPKKASTRVVMNTAELRKACRTADIFAREASHTAKVAIVPATELLDGYASIAATSQETGDNVAQIDAAVDGAGVEISFNVRFLHEALNVIDTPQVILETNSPMEPGVVKPVDEDGFLHVIMPMHFGR